MAEAAQQDYEAWLRCIGRIAEKRGWLLCSGTFEGSEGWYAEKWEEWQNPDNTDSAVSWSMPSWTNKIVYPLGRQDPEILRLEVLYQRIEGMFEERLGAVPVPPTNLVFREFRQTIHVTDQFDFDSSLPVYIAVDPSAGTNPYSVLACQFRKHIRTEPHPDPIDFCVVIDEIYWSNRIAEAVIEEALTRRWWKNVRGGAIDPEAPDDRKRWLKYAKVNLKGGEKVQQLAGIRRLKSFLYFKKDKHTGELTEPPHLLINPRVKSLPYEFHHCKRNLAAKEDREPLDKIPSGVPDHSIKALWYLLIARYGQIKGGEVKKPAQTWRRKK